MTDRIFLLTGPMQKILSSALFLSLVGTPAFASDIDIAGVWYTEDKGAKVEVTDCGDGTPCGNLIWFEPDGSGVTNDFYNPDPELQKQPLIGSRVFWGFKPKKNRWHKGRIYDAGSGKTYKSKLQLAEDGTLKVKGCVGPICQTQIWTRVEN